MFATVPAMAAIVGGTLTGGDAPINGGLFQVISPPASVGGSNTINYNVIAFNEQQNITLGSNLSVNVGSMIALGTTVSSYYVDFDPVANSTVTGTVTFDQQVLGIIDLTAGLNGTNSLFGNSSTTYFTGALAGFEAGDIATISGNTVSFNLSANTPGDAFRVITAAAVPEPATWSMFIGGFGLVGAAMRRKKMSIGSASA